MHPPRGSHWSLRPPAQPLSAPLFSLSTKRLGGSLVISLVPDAAAPTGPVPQVALEPRGFAPREFALLGPQQGGGAPGDFGTVTMRLD